MENLLESIQTVISPTKSERRFGEYITQNPTEAIQSTLTVLAKKSGVSSTAIIRFCQKLGYKGYSEFRFDMSRLILSGQSGKKLATDTSGRVLAIIDKYAEYIQRMAAEVNISELQALAKQLCKATRIVAFGNNRTAAPPQQLAMRLIKLGCVCQPIVNDRVNMMEYGNMLTPDDHLLIFSISGNPTYGEICEHVNNHGVPITLLTMNAQTPLKKHVNSLITLPRISRAGDIGFLDDQPIYLIFIELLLSEIATLMRADT